MKHLLAITAILLALQTSHAQEQYRVAPGYNAPATIALQGQQANINSAPAPVAAGQECKTTVCVSEPKKNTKTVYTSVCKEYCVPHCSLFSLFGGDCGCGENCEKRTKNVLVKKKVATCDTTQCVLKEVPAGGCVPCGK
ncbi:MAG TPA: hypothetical protein PLX97_12275 [Gemmatales bacterium]|nr:hypothetical protein [Gemmatales bacterium]